jgi:ubiquinone/menaquinone biosynthesis C-methylase UbiE
VDIRQSAAERLPFPDDAFDAALAQLVVHLASLDADQQAALRERCRRRLPEGPVEVSATAWAATGRP